MLDRAAKAVIAGVLVAVVALAAGGRLEGDYPEFYGAGRIVRAGDGHRIYDPGVQARSQRGLYPEGRTGYLDFAYPPAVAAAYAPLSLLPYRLSYAVHAVLLMLALALAVHLLRPAVPAIERRPWVAYALALTAYPMARAVGAGQNTALTVLAVAAWWRWRWDGKPLLAGMAAGALLCKPQFAGLFLIAVLLDRSVPAVLGTVASAAALWVASAAVGGFGWMSAFVDHAVHLPQAERGVAGTSGVSIPFVASELLPGGRAAGAVAGVLVLASAAAALAVWARRRRSDAPAQLAGVGALAAATVLVPPHVIFYDAGLLVLTGAGLAAAGPRWARSGWLLLYLAAFSGAAATTLGANPLVVVALCGQALVSASRT